MRVRWEVVARSCLLVALSACAPPPSADAHVPPFARIPYEPFSRDAVVAIALREWRLFGSPVDDDPPGSYRPATPDDKPERQQGPVAARRRILVAGDECRRAGSRLDRQARRERRRVSGERGRHLRLVGRLRVLCDAHRRCRRALSVFRQPFGLHQPGEADEAWSDIGLVDRRRALPRPMRRSLAT